MRSFPTLKEVQLILQHFDFVFITHVFRELNHVANSLSKEGVEI